jgi:hypothetical protein
MIKALTLGEAARAATITKRHLEGLISRGEGPIITALGARKIILEPDYDAWLQSRRQVKRTKTPAPTELGPAAKPAVVPVQATPPAKAKATPVTDARSPPI